MVLFEEAGSESIYIQGDDDSGFERNALIRERLKKPEGQVFILDILPKKQ